MDFIWLTGEGVGGAEEKNALKQQQQQLHISH